MNQAAVPEDFVGRQSELAKLSSLCRPGSLITVHGPAGAGKSRLAREYLARGPQLTGERFWFVPLGQLSADAVLVPAIATALGLNSSVLPLEEQIVTYLQDSPGLLVLDNCEHLAGAVSDFVQQVLERASSCAILVTSRVEFGLAREAVLRIEGLPAEPDGAAASEAAQLFLARARSRGSLASVGRVEAAAIEEICQRLDGLPLAIELAAARLRVLTVQQISERLDQPLQLLRSRSRKLHSGQVALRTSIELSYLICDEAEQRAWRRLAVFAGAFSLADVAGVFGVDFELAVDRLESLLEKSVLLQDPTPGQDGATRFRMLYVIRSFGLEKLAEVGEETTVRRAHAEWFAQLAATAEAEWVGPDQPRLIARLDEARADIRAVLEFSLADGRPDLAFQAGVASTAQLWWITGSIEEGRHWIERILEQLDGPPADRLLALLDAAILALAKGEFDVATEYLTESHRLIDGEDPPSPKHIAFIGFDESFHALVRGDFEQARAIAERSLRAVEGIEILPVRFRLLQVAAYASNGLGDAVTGTRICHELIDLADRFGDVYNKGFALHVLALYAWRDGDLDRARELSNQGMLLSRAFPNRPENPDALLIAGYIAAASGQTARAATLFGAAEATSRTRVATSAVFAESVAESERLQAWHAQIREQLHPGATLVGHGMTPAEAVAFACEQPAALPARPSLTPRELEVAALVADGLTNREIAARLSIAVRSAEGHVERIRNKLDVRSRVQIGTWFLRERVATEADASAPTVPG